MYIVSILKTMYFDAPFSSAFNIITLFTYKKEMCIVSILKTIKIM